MLDKIKKLQQNMLSYFVVDTNLKGDIIRLKFQDNHTMVIVTFEDFILTVYVIIDDLYRQFAPTDVIHRRHILDLKRSDSELITVGICGELAGINS